MQTEFKPVGGVLENMARNGVWPFEKSSKVCEKCNQPTDELHGSWQGSEPIQWLCKTCWVPREPKAAAVRVVDVTPHAYTPRGGEFGSATDVSCDDFVPEVRTRAVGGPLRDVAAETDGQGDVPERTA